ncbi:hypothetical protein D9758_013850 [Tetrapyrgos nigripes]|uniref:Uncharacterized protein n=1 Tax=Tetrapyrgos nigripes TaxID=182062 RepID=A0A8H5CQI0_9AGAR|nr:hypothetical protein D9758_013850 [Tetrapyrgos nigripes]
MLDAIKSSSQKLCNPIYSRNLITLPLPIGPLLITPAAALRLHFAQDTLTRQERIDMTEN